MLSIEVQDECLCFILSIEVQDECLFFLASNISSNILDL